MSGIKVPCAAVAHTDNHCRYRGFQKVKDKSDNRFSIEPDKCHSQRGKSRLNPCNRFSSFLAFLAGVYQRGLIVVIVM